MDIIQFKNELELEFNNDENLLKQLQECYTYQGYTPSIKIDGDIVYIHIDEAVFKNTAKDFSKATDFCNSGQFDKAKTLLEHIIETCPLHVDAHRILAQIEMERGNYEDAYNKNLDALRIDPSNLWALILMGNICVKKNDLDLADIFYNKVLDYHPNDNLALNNIAGTYIQAKKYDKAIELFEKVLKQDDTYLNTYYGIALTYYNKGVSDKALEYCIQGMKKGVNRPQDRGIRDEIQKLAMTVAHDITDKFDFSIEIGMEKKRLSEMTDVPLKVEEDSTINVNARMEYYIAHRRSFNRVVYNPTKKYHAHLLMHEFMHLEMAIEASKVSKNKLTVEGDKEAGAFRKWIAPELGKLRGMLTEERLGMFVSQMHQGLMLQAMNSPLDLLVEDRIYKNYPALRPLQMLSLVEMEIENVDSVTKSAKSEIPKKIVSANRIMNVVSALHLQDMYGFNIAPHYKPTPNEKKIADDLYEEYKAYKDDYAPGEEYDLLEYFVESLGLTEFFELVNEIHFKNLNLPPKNEVPQESIDPASHEEQTAAFAEIHKDGENPAETMMMSMYMLGTMEYLKNLPQYDVHSIAIEIAVVGVNGINPNNKGYKIDALPDREFGGFEFLAWYYVSWAIAIPEKLSSLGLPFSQAYEAAKQMFDLNSGK